NHFIKTPYSVKRKRHLASLGLQSAVHWFNYLEDKNLFLSPLIPIIAQKETFVNTFSQKI
ncbi:TPA: hypothetical protein ACV8EI_005488, partial [Escherichia coli]